MSAQKERISLSSSASELFGEELLELFEFKLENDNVSLTPSTKAQEFSLELSVMMHKLDQQSTPTAPSSELKQLGSRESTESLELSLGGEGEVPMHLADVFLALQQTFGSEKAKQQTLPKLQSKNSLKRASHSAYSSPPASPFLQSPSTTPADPSEMSLESFLNDDHSPNLDLKPIRLSISESLKSSSSFRRQFVQAPKPKTVRFDLEEDRVSLNSSGQTENDDDIDDQSTISAGSVHDDANDFELALASDETKKIVMSPLVAQGEERVEGLYVVTSPKKQKKNRFSGILTQLFKSDKSSKQRKRISSGDSSSLSSDNTPFRTVSLPRSPSTLQQSFPSPVFSEKSPVISVVKAEDLLPLSPVSAPVSINAIAPELPPRKKSADSLVLNAESRVLDAPACDSTPKVTPSRTWQTQTDETRSASFSCQTDNLTVAAVTVDAGMQTVEMESAKECPSCRQESESVGAMPSTPSTLVSDPWKRNHRGSVEGSDRSDETMSGEAEKQQAEMNHLHEENIRLLQELHAMKLIVSTSRSQTQQMQILKEAAEARFEQLARVAHRKLLRAMVESDQ